MKFTIRSLMAAAVLSTFTCAAADEGGFVPLFNGRDLSNWTNVNVAPETFTVRDGIIVSTGLPTGVMRTKRMYENFVAELEWRHMKEGGNAGFFIYSAPVTAVGQPFTKGMEIQIIDRDHPQGIATRHGDVFSIHGATFVPYEPHPQGWMRSLPKEKRVKPQGEWNHYRVESIDGRVTLSVNGKEVSGGSNCVPRKGYICLESEGSECHFRNIRIKELPSSNPPENQISDEDQGFVSLYTGLDLRGWKESPSAKGHWQAKDWILDWDGKGADGGNSLTSERAFHDFELILDWRLSGDEKSKDPLTYASFIKLCETVKLPFDSPEAKPPGQWNRIRFTMRGEKMTVRLNDKLLADKMVAPTGTGPIVFHLAGKPMQFANIYIRELK